MHEKNIIIKTQDGKLDCKVFINRKDGTTKKWRYIINESDVETNLEKKGFNISIGCNLKK